MKTLKDLAVPLGASPADLRIAASQALGVPPQLVFDLRIRKVSLDARARPPKKVYTVDVWLVGDAHHPEPPPALRRPAYVRPGRSPESPIIVGTGPAGLWAALRLIEAGHAPILLDRGAALPGRHDATRKLRRDGILDPETNLCFGAGGAGTYSDGKLYTRRRDPEIARIYDDLVALGAPSEILVEAHPHVGTNRLIKILSDLERFLLDSGTDLRYGAKVVSLIRSVESGRVVGVRLDTGEEILGSAVILATGHSARDVYTWLHASGVALAPKPFAVGARCEHPQARIDQIQYGMNAGHPALDPSEYFLTAQIGARGVYSFCMCPGGFVIPTTTELLHLNVNGMSNHKRGSDFANAALVVTVGPEDFYLESPGDLDHHGPLAGIAFQRALEAKAYALGGGGYVAPAQRLTDFVANRASLTLPPRTSYRPLHEEAARGHRGLTPSDLREILPERLHTPLARAVFRFDQKMRGYLGEDAILIGVETTTSSPVRILRDEATLEAPGFPGLFPTGEGAGQAGGIVSSALDGMRSAEAALATITRFQATNRPQLPTTFDR